jgi:hypothetical protein
MSTPGSHQPWRSARGQVKILDVPPSPPPLNLPSLPKTVTELPTFSRAGGLLEYSKCIMSEGKELLLYLYEQKGTDKFLLVHNQASNLKDV